MKLGSEQRIRVQTELIRTLVEREAAFRSDKKRPPLHRKTHDEEEGIIQGLHQAYLHQGTDSCPGCSVILALDLIEAELGDMLLGPLVESASGVPISEIPEMQFPNLKELEHGQPVP